MLGRSQARACARSLLDGLVVGEAMVELGTAVVGVAVGTVGGVGEPDSGVSVGWVWPRMWCCGCDVVTAGGGGSMSTGSGGIGVGVVVSVVSAGLNSPTRGMPHLSPEYHG